jgi:hypothetical protein
VSGAGDQGGGQSAAAAGGEGGVDGKPTAAAVVAAAAAAPSASAAGLGAGGAAAATGEAPPPIRQTGYLRHLGNTLAGALNVFSSKRGAAAGGGGAEGGGGGGGGGGDDDVSGGAVEGLTVDSIKRNLEQSQVLLDKHVTDVTDPVQSQAVLDKYPDKFPAAISPETPSTAPPPPGPDNGAEKLSLRKTPLRYLKRKFDGVGRLFSRRGGGGKGAKEEPLQAVTPTVATDPVDAPPPPGHGAAAA